MNNFALIGDESKSGGIATNIGMYFFDMLIWIFGNVKHVDVYNSSRVNASAYLELERARVKWNLSIEYNDLPGAVKAAGQRTFRSLSIENEEIEFSEGFTELHTASYREILPGNGFGLEDARPSIELAHAIRNAKITS